MAIPANAGTHMVPIEKEVDPLEPSVGVDEERQTKPAGWKRIVSMVEEKGDVEIRGCEPVPYEERTETNYFNIFTLWFSMSCNPLPYVLFLNLL